MEVELANLYSKAKMDVTKAAAYFNVLKKNGVKKY